MPDYWVGPCRLFIVSEAVGAEAWTLGFANLLRHSRYHQQVPTRGKKTLTAMAV
jgi:hypothetical protein